ncbi:hypothetical protein SLEP1_g36500 [Rubroshorea leprosula]|uniref:Uncharacterized protein n=1 Tax=Rubroshorea leprosula TaxID=152421 RepID=A0AAV5KRX4_9ROSI|nr:hypothetical protein SLEP1_g36500 [Rubroshorea leprosula]
MLCEYMFQYFMAVASEVTFTSSTQCSYPSSPAFGLGLTAAVALLIAQIIINGSTGCICCKRSPEPWNSNWTRALICFVTSWFTFVIAFLLLLTGAALNDEHGEQTVYFGNYYCYVVKPGVFSCGALLSLVSVTLGILYYLTINLRKTSNGTWGSAVPNQGGIAMGQPQFPPQSTAGPVFVHEDTYMRRQFP